MKADVLEALRQHFRPEFLNRVDEVVVFHSLTREQLKQQRYRTVSTGTDAKAGRNIRSLEYILQIQSP